MFVTLMYHLVADAISHPMCISPRQLREQLTALHRRGLEILTLPRALERLRGGDAAPGVLLTFDDGYANSVDVSLPLLEAFAAPAVLAVCSSYLFPQLRPASTVHISQDFADLARIRAWIRSGRDVAGHSYAHPKLTKLSDSEVTWQVAEDQRLLQRAFGQAPRAFVYPFGSVDERVSRLVQGLYEAAFTDERGCHPGVGSNWMLRRSRVRPEWSLDDFERVVSEELSTCVRQQSRRLRDS